MRVSDTTPIGLCEMDWRVCILPLRRDTSFPATRDAMGNAQVPSSYWYTCCNNGISEDCLAWRMHITGNSSSMVTSKRQSSLRAG